MKLTGKLVFASGRSTDFDIFSLDLITSKLTQLTEGSHFNTMPRWSPDGSQIAFIRTGSDYVSSLYLMSADGNDVQRLTDDCHSLSPCWYPDGSKILFTSNFSEGKEIDVCSYDVGSGKKEVLFQRNHQETEPCMSLDGKRVIFSSVSSGSDKPFNERNTEIFEYDLASKEIRELFSHPARDHSPVYSPDGSKIAFVSHRNGTTEADYSEKLREIKAAMDIKDKNSVKAAISKLQDLDDDSDIYVGNADGTDIKKLTSNQGADISVRWSPCGKYLVYSATNNRSKGNRLRILDVETTAEIKLDYDRTALMGEMGVSVEDVINQNPFSKILPDWIERPIMMRLMGEAIWGEEQWPDWTA